MLQNRVDKLEIQVCLLEDTLINNEIKINSADQCSRQNNIVIQAIPQSIKSKDLEEKIVNVLDKVNVKVTKNDRRVPSVGWQKNNSEVGQSKIFV